MKVGDKVTALISGVIVKTEITKSANPGNEMFWVKGGWHWYTQTELNEAESMRLKIEATCDRVFQSDLRRMDQD